MIIAIYVITFSLSMLALWLLKRGDRYQNSAKALAQQVVAYREANLALKQTPVEKSLTQAKVKAQDTPKRVSGAQLRRMAEKNNADTMASLQERPNSEILKEQENA
jgi:hypothetical protein